MFLCLSARWKSTLGSDPWHDCDLNGAASHKFMITKFQMKYQKMIYKQHNSFITLTLRFWRLTSFREPMNRTPRRTGKKNFDGNFFSQENIRRIKELDERRKSVQSKDRKARKKEFALLMFWHLKCAKCACFFFYSRWMKTHTKRLKTTVNVNTLIVGVVKWWFLYNLIDDY